MAKKKDKIIPKSYSLSEEVAEWVDSEAKAQHYRSTSHFVETILREKRDASKRAKN